MENHNVTFIPQSVQQPDFSLFIEQILLPGKMIPVQLTPLYSHSISAGFPSPADDYIEDWLDLNELLVSNKAATFFLRVKGDSMVNAGIHHGDIIVVDRSLQPVHRAIVVAVVRLDGEMPPGGQEGRDVEDRQDEAGPPRAIVASERKKSRALFRKHGTS